MKKRKLAVAILAGLMAFIMILSLILSLIPTNVFAARSSSEIRQQINALQSERKEIQAQMDALQKEIDANQSETIDILAKKNAIDKQTGILRMELSNINDQISSYTVLIAEKQDELDDAQQSWQELNDANRERIRAMEEGGRLSYWSVLFKANSFMDFLDRLAIMQEIAAADQRRLEALGKAADKVSEARAELETEKQALEDIRVELDETQAELNARRAESDEIINDLIAKQDEMSDTYAEYEALEAATAAKIASEESAYSEAKRREWELAHPTTKPAPTTKPTSGNSGNSGNGDTTATEPTGTNTGSSETFLKPCSYSKVTDVYGYRIHPTTGKNSFHNGVDLAASQGTPIYASKSGAVTASYSEVYGYYVTIDHADGWKTLYGHMTHYVVSSGQYVSRGQLIGYVGSTGWSTGPHLHFTIFKNGSSVNPLSYI